MVRLPYTVRCGREPTDISSIVLVEPGGCFIKSDAVLRIAAGLDAPLQLLAWLGELTPRGLRDPLYDAVRAMPYPPPSPLHLLLPSHSRTVILRLRVKGPTVHLC